MVRYTVELREKGKRTPYYVAEDLSIMHTANRCKPLTLKEARLAKKLFIEGAKKAGREIIARCVLLPDYD